VPVCNDNNELLGVNHMPVQDLVDALINIGDKYPPKSEYLLDKFKFWDKHDNQKAAGELKSIRNAINSNVPEKLQEVQLLAALVDILTLKDFTYSSKLIPEVKKELTAYESFNKLDSYLPDDTNKDYPKISDLRDALHTLAKILHLKYDLEHSVKKAQAEISEKAEFEEHARVLTRTS
jgi:uncharacterized coiled-coil DUF342 family protein